MGFENVENDNGSDLKIDKDDNAATAGPAVPFLKVMRARSGDGSGDLISQTSNLYLTTCRAGRVEIVNLTARFFRTAQH